MKSLQIINGDIAFDSRGKAIIVEGNTKVSNQVNYALSTSAFIQNLFLPSGTIKLNSNEAAIREAISKTIQSLISSHSQQNLPANETLTAMSELQVTSINKTDFQFVVKLITRAGEFNLQFSRG